MRQKRYDVIIVGAGVSGLMLAKLLNGSGLDVLLLEKRKTVKKLLNHRFGTFTETANKFGMQKSVVKDYKKCAIFSNDDMVEFSYKKPEFAVVDMNIFAKNLKLDCDVITGFDLRYAVKAEHGIVISDTVSKYYAKIAVDCSGDSMVLSEKLGLKQKRDRLDSLSTAWEMKGCNIEKQDAMIFLGDLRYANVGFWLYPYSKKECQFGHSDLVSRKLPVIKGQANSIGNYVRDRDPCKTWFKDAKIKQKIIKIGPTQMVVRKSYDDNVLMCGDAAGAGTPITGEGFRIALEMALSAYKTIKVAFHRADFTKDTLSMHEDNFYREFKKNYRWLRVLQYILLHYTTNKGYSMVIKRLKKLSAKEFMSFMRSEITFSIFAKMFSIKSAVYFKYCALKYHLTGKLNKRIT